MLRLLCLLALAAGLVLPRPAAAGPHSETWLRFALVPETNPVRRTSAERIEILGLPFVLNADAREKSATALRIGFGHVWAPPVAPDKRLRFAVMGDVRLFEDSSLNDITLRGEAGLEIAQGTQGRLDFGVLVQGRWLGGSVHSRAPGLWLGWQRLLGPATLVQARGEVLWPVHPDNPGADGRRTTVSLGLRHRAGPRLVLSAEATLTRQAAAVAAEAGRSAGLTLGADYAFDNGLAVGVTLGRAGQRRDGPSPLFGQVRDDRLTTVALRLSHRELRIAGQVPVLEIAHERQTSTIALHDYRTTRISIGFVRRF